MEVGCEYTLDYSSTDMAILSCPNKKTMNIGARSHLASVLRRFGGGRNTRSSSAGGPQNV